MLILNQLGDEIFDTANAAIWVNDQNCICLCSAEEYGKDPDVRVAYILGSYATYETAHKVMRDIAKYAAAGRGAFAMPSTEKPKEDPQNG